MKTQHTPGPWKIDNANTPVYSVGIRGGDDYAFIVCDITDDGYSKEENDANAKLIAAAPELLAACQEFVRKVESGEAKSTRSYAQMKEAIKKATE